MKLSFHFILLVPLLTIHFAKFFIDIHSKIKFVVYYKTIIY